MVVLVFVGHTEVKAHFVQKMGLRQLHAFGIEVARHIKHQSVSAFAQAGVVVQQAVGVAAIAV